MVMGVPPGLTVPECPEQKPPPRESGQSRPGDGLCQRSPRAVVTHHSDEYAQPTRYRSAPHCQPTMHTEYWQIPVSSAAEDRSVELEDSGVAGGPPLTTFDPEWTPFPPPRIAHPALV